MLYFDNPTTIAQTYNMDRRAVLRLLNLGIIKKESVQKGIHMGKQLKGFSIFVVPNNVEDYFYKRKIFEDQNTTN